MTNNNYVGKLSSKNRIIIIVLFFFVLGFSIYSNALHGEFVSDDHVLISNNYTIKDLGNINLIWASLKTRFIPLLTFAVNYHFNELNVFWYHFVNIFIHIINSSLVFYLALLTFRVSKIKINISLQENSLLPPLIAGGIYLCHPIQTQAVSFVTQRLVLIVTFFYLSTIIFYIKYRLSGSLSYYVLSFATVLLGIFSKESIVTIPFSILLYEWFFLKKPDERFRHVFKKAFPYFIVMMILPMLFFFSKSDSIYGLKDQLISRGISFKYFLTEIKAFVIYLQLIILPINQSHHHYVSISSGITSLNTLFSVLIILFLFFLGFALYKKDKVLSFCAFWFFITSSVEAVVVTIVNRKLMDEHWMYLPMAGVSIVLAILICRIFKNRKLIIWAAVLLFSMYSVLTFNRNKTWQTEVSLWEDVFWHNKKDLAVYVGLGEAYETKDMHEKAEKVYIKGLELFPKSFRLLNNLGVVYYFEGRDKLAEAVFKKAIEVNPSFGESYNNLAYFYFNAKNYNQALKYYEESLKYQKSYPEAYYYMGQCALSLGKKKQALDYLNKALGLYKQKDQAGDVFLIEKLIKENSSETNMGKE